MGSEMCIRDSANRVYDDEKENGLIVDYGNVYKQLEKAYSIYGEGGANSKNPGREEKPVELLELMEKELINAIDAVRLHLSELGFDLNIFRQADLKPMTRLSLVKKGADAVCLNETTRAKFEILAREVFKKYLALFPESNARKHTKVYNDISAIYNQLNQQVKEADIYDIIHNLQQIVNQSVEINSGASEPLPVEIDLSNLDLSLIHI